MNTSCDNKRIGVVHLIRKSNGIEPFENFISSYKEYGAGIQHSFLLVFKGFNSVSEITDYETLLSGVKYEKLFVDDTGFDIGSYMCAFNKYKNNHEYFCFINSYSKILCENWLTMLCQHITKPGIGLVGATGSYQSIFSDCLYKNYAYGRVFKFHPVRKPILKFRLYIRKFKYKGFFPEFPNAHIRTNAFMLSTKVLSQIKVSNFKKKMDAYRFESGKQSLTRQIQDMNLEPVIIDSEGKAYEVADWYKSNTFRRSNQENLLISDNQTKIYDDANKRLKVIYSHHTWGSNCLPDESSLT